MVAPDLFWEYFSFLYVPIIHLKVVLISCFNFLLKGYLLTSKQSSQYVENRFLPY